MTEILDLLGNTGFVLDPQKEEYFPNKRRVKPETRYVKPARIRGLEHLHPRDVFVLKGDDLWQYMLEFSDHPDFWANNYSTYAKGKDPGRNKGFKEADLLKFPSWLHPALEHLVTGKVDSRDLYILMLSIYDETTDIEAEALYKNEKFMGVLTNVANSFFANGLEPRVHGFWNRHWTYAHYIISCENENVNVTLRWEPPLGEVLQIVYQGGEDCHERKIYCSQTQDHDGLRTLIADDLRENNWRNLLIVEGYSDRFDSLLARIRHGEVSIYDIQKAKEYAQQHGFSTEEVDRTEPIGGRARFNECLKLIRQCQTKSIQDAYFWAQKYGLPTQRVDRAVENLRRRETQRRLSYE